MLVLNMVEFELCRQPVKSPSKFRSNFSKRLSKPAAQASLKPFVLALSFSPHRMPMLASVDSVAKFASRARWRS